MSKNNNAAAVLFALVFLLFSGIAAYTQYFWLALIPFIAILFYAGWQAVNITFLLLLISLPFSMEYQVTETLGTDLPDELLMVAVSAFFVCFFAYRPQFLSYSARIHPVIIVLLLSILWTIVTVIFSKEPQLSVKYLIAKSWYLGAFVLAPLIVLRNKTSIRYAAMALTSAMIVAVIIILVRHSLKGFSFATINEAVHPFFRNHVNYSAMLVCVIPIIVVYLKNSAAGKLKIFTSLVLIIMLAALFLSYARGAWLALLIGIVAAWLIRKKRLLSAYILTIIIIIAALFWIKSDDRYLEFAHEYKTTIWHSDFKEHLEATYQFKDVSTAERFYRWIAGVRMAKDNWLTGNGPNTFYPAYKSYAIPAFKTWVSSNPEHSTVHNYFLLLAIEQGIPGLILFLLLTGMLLYYAQVLYHRIADPFYRTLSLTIGTILVMILVVNSLSDLVETDKVGSLFYLCLSLLIVADLKTRKTN